MEVFKNFLVFPIDYKSKIAFLSIEDTSKSWTFDVDWNYPLNTAKPKGFLESAKEENYDEENQNNEIIGDHGDKGVHLIAICERNKLLAFTSNEKSLFLCKIEENQVKILSRRLFIRTTSCLKFSNCGKMIFLADKTGDVFQYSCEDLKSPGKYIFGHISQILDLKSTSNYILTSERDEKIRVTNYPATHEIEAFCLGHLEFVSSFDFIDNERIISVSGDKTMKLWKFIDGSQLDSLDLDFIPLQIKIFTQLLFISSMSNQLTIYEFHLDRDKLKIKKKSEKQYPSDSEMVSCYGKFYVKFVQEGKIFIDEVNVKEKLTVYKSLHEDVLALLNCPNTSVSTFKPFDINYLFKNCRIDKDREIDHVERKRVKIDEIKERKAKNKNRYRVKN